MKDTFESMKKLDSKVNKEFGHLLQQNYMKEVYRISGGSSKKKFDLYNTEHKSFFKVYFRIRIGTKERYSYI